MIKSNISVRNYSEPLQQQSMTTAYGERIFSVTSFDSELAPTAYDLQKYAHEQIRTWRQMVRNPYIDFAVDDIVNEMLASDDTEVFPIDLDLANTPWSDNIKNKIYDEFILLQRKLCFNRKAYTMIRDWYIDGRAYYYIKYNGKLIDEIIQLDPLRIQRVNDKDGNLESYIYQDVDLTNTVYEIPPECLIELNSGLMDDKHRIWISYLAKAFIPLNQVNSIEDALVIYRLSRAPERRVFYVDVGEMSPSKAEAYMRELILNYRNKMEYDSTTGTMKEKVRHMSLLDDIWLPRRGGTGTDVSTLSGGQNLGQIEDIEYFLKKLFRSLNIPYSRWGDTEGAANVMGRTTEISRDEAKYNKFICRLRAQYNTLFYILLRIALDRKKIILKKEFDEEKDSIIFKWNSDSMFSTFKAFDMMNERAEVLEKFMPHVGKFVSLNWVRRNILGYTDDEIRDIMKEIRSEKEEMKELKINPDDEQFQQNNFDHNDDDNNDRQPREGFGGYKVIDTEYTKSNEEDTNGQENS